MWFVKSLRKIESAWKKMGYLVSDKITLFSSQVSEKVETAVTALSLKYSLSTVLVDLIRES